MARNADRVVVAGTGLEAAAPSVVAQNGSRTDWVLAGMWSGVIVLAALGLLSLVFGVVPFSLLAMATAFISWGFADVRAFLSGWRAPRAFALAWLRVTAVWFTAALLIVGVVVPQAWMLGASGVLVFLLLRVVCGNSGSKAVHDFEKKLLEQDNP